MNSEEKPPTPTAPTNSLTLLQPVHNNPYSLPSFGQFGAGTKKIPTLWLITELSQNSLIPKFSEIILYSLKDFIKYVCFSSLQSRMEQNTVMVMDSIPQLIITHMAQVCLVSEAYYYY